MEILSERSKIRRGAPRCRLLLFLLALLAATGGRAQTRDLPYFIEEARASSPALRDLQGQLTAARIDSLLLQAARRTQVAFQSTNSYAPIIRGVGYDEAITNIANVSALLQATRNFSTRGAVQAQLQTIALQRQALMDTLRLSQQDLVRTITDQYITAYGDQVTADFGHEIYLLMRREEEALKKLTEKGVYKQVDYLSFYVTMQQQDLAALQAGIQYAADFLTLNYLAGIVDTSVLRLEPPRLPDSLPDFYGSVFYTRYRTDSLRLANERSLLRYQYKPKVGAYTDAGYQSSLQNTAWRNFGFSFGLSLLVPIYDGHQRQLREQQLDIRERSRVNSRDFYVRQYTMQVAQLRKQLQSIDQLNVRLQKQIEFSRTLIEANGKLLQVGDITMKDYVTAINNYLNAQNLLRQNTLGRLKVLSQLNYWNAKP
ncbi:TolC family protein [Flaviaesturariibacter aridisoli]|uniref:TolC family protein n=1 Tax=Flaviaesturariibacter aridisoli TaxID=2545761 RepID=A0A4R4DTY8_9BACT|nr:TolC family protein [Flaviaesturariibacter aridisoli]